MEMAQSHNLLGGKYGRKTDGGNEDNCPFYN